MLQIREMSLSIYFLMALDLNIRFENPVNVLLAFGQPKWGIETICEKRKTGKITQNWLVYMGIMWNHQIVHTATRKTATAHVFMNGKYSYFYTFMHNYDHCGLYYKEVLDGIEILYTAVHLTNSKIAFSVVERITFYELQ